MQSFSNFHIILVEPEESLNVGSVARAMKNLGFTNLHLVSPKEFKPERAKITAVWADDLVDKVKIHTSLTETLAPLHEIVGFSGRAGKNRGSPQLLESWALTLELNSKKQIGLVFGPEDHGLTAEHTQLCSTLVRIPASEEYSSYNLAQAVLLVLFELRRRTWPAAPAADSSPVWNDFYQLDRLVESVAKRSGFYRQGTPEPVPGLIKSMLRRMHPTAREMSILLGLFGRIERTLSGESPVYEVEPD